MSDEEDETPVISLAARREAEQRNFAEEHSENVKELLELGLSKEEATAGSIEVMLCDWLAFRAVVTLERFQEHLSTEVSTEDLVKLIEIMRRGIDERLRG